MKKLMMLFLLAPMFAFNTLQTKNDFIGKWAGEEKDNIGFITFDNEGYAAFEIQGQVMGGKEFEINGEKGMMVYTINMKADPIELDLTMTKLTSGEVKTMLCIAKFDDKNTMQFAMGLENVRPVDFNGDTAILLKRVIVPTKN